LYVGVWMKIAIPRWKDRVSPVFDVADTIWIVETHSRRPLEKSEHKLSATEPAARAAELAGLGADLLICGAVSTPLEAALRAAGVEVVPFVCGPVEEVLGAHLDGKLHGPAYRMPGCRSGKQRCHEAGREAGKRFGRGGGKCASAASAPGKASNGRRRYERPAAPSAGHCAERSAAERHGRWGRCGNHGDEDCHGAGWTGKGARHRDDERLRR